MKTLDLPEGNAFGADESDSATPYVEDVEQRAQTLFFVWVTLTEHKWVIFGERRGRGGESRNLWIVDSSGAHGQKLLEYKGSTENGLDWTPDGKLIVYSGLAAGRAQLFAVPRAGGEPRQLSHDPGNLMHPRVSPDGRWLACTRRSQSQQIWRRPLLRK